MKIRGHGNAVAIALAGLAVVLAATGTAYAVTTTTVNIADPNTPAHIANVDSSGHLLTTGSASTINSLASISDYSYFTPITSPTTGTLAITSVTYSNVLGNASVANASFDLELEQVNADGSGVCERTGIYVDVAPYISITPGQTVEQTFASPLIVRARAGAKYCLSAYLIPADGTAPSTAATYPQIQLTAYVNSGTYTGIGTSATPAKAPGNTARGAKAGR